MPTITKQISITDQTRLKILRWANSFPYFLYFNPNNDPNGFKHQIAVAEEPTINSSEGSFSKLESFIANKNQPLFGFFSFELKDEIHPLPAKKTTIPAPHALFFVPKFRIEFSEHDITIQGQEPEKLFNEIMMFEDNTTVVPSTKINLNSSTSKEEYIENCLEIKQDILNGEYYEMNYCIEYSADSCTVDPIAKYLQLNDVSPMPFSCLGKFDHVFTICASPERFIKKEGLNLTSQPIKGTIRRGKDETEDQQLKTILRNSQKEIAENMMIVDLVRNDLNRSSQTGTVKVDEFFGIYSFKQVHQMISTISSIAKENISITDIIKNAFPMGSMTGAPKIRVLQAINEYEVSQRGIYSGGMGYITPEGDFDFNVVIRSIIYDNRSNKISFHVGSAITYDADPEYEYEECLLKARSMMEILSKE